MAHVFSPNYLGLVQRGCSRRLSVPNYLSNHAAPTSAHRPGQLRRHRQALTDLKKAHQRKARAARRLGTMWSASPKGSNKSGSGHRASEKIRIGSPFETNHTRTTTAQCTDHPHTLTLILTLGTAFENRHGHGTQCAKAVVMGVLVN